VSNAKARMEAVTASARASAAAPATAIRCCDQDAPGMPGGIPIGGGIPLGIAPIGIPGGGIMPIGGIPRGGAIMPGGGAIPMPIGPRGPPMPGGNIEPGAGPPTPRTGPAKPAGAAAMSVPRPAGRATPGPAAACCVLGARGYDSTCSETTCSPRNNIRPSTRFSSTSSAAGGQRRRWGRER
jgi:hypothetical protein